MKKASEYREHARECRSLAAAMPSDEQRSQMVKMADQWDKLAAERSAMIYRHPELARAGEQDEERASAS